jgi:hypothetical protein
MLRKSKNYYVPGGYNVICPRCGFKYKNTDVQLEWDKLLVCRKHCWEPRQPQDFVKGVPDMKPVPIACPEQPNVFITTPVNPEDL